jgi:Cu/Ag efflux protein CusF/cytochrome c5
MSSKLLALGMGWALALFVSAATVDSAERGAAKSQAAVQAAEPHHPRNWRFTMPRGDTAKGRSVFDKFECYYCHRINGETFPEPTDSAPELSQMGQLHPLEYFTESVIHPNAVVPRQLRNRDGSSPMSKDHIERMTLRELIDLSSYLAGLKPPTLAKSVNGVGKIVAVVRQSQEVVIDHEEITGFMDAMTMGYKLESPAQLQGLRPGDVVNFSIDTGKRVITKIEKSKK